MIWEKARAGVFSLLPGSSSWTWPCVHWRPPSPPAASSVCPTAAGSSLWGSHTSPRSLPYVPPAVGPEKHHLSVKMLLLEFYIQVQAEAFELPLELDDRGRRSDLHDRWAVLERWYFLLKGRRNPHPHTQHLSQSWSLGCGPALPCVIKSAFSGPWTQHAASPVNTNDLSYSRSKRWKCSAVVYYQVMKQEPHTPQKSEWLPSINHLKCESFSVFNFTLLVLKPISPLPSLHSGCECAVGSSPAVPLRGQSLLQCHKA